MPSAFNRACPAFRRMPACRSCFRQRPLRRPCGTQRPISSLQRLPSVRFGDEHSRGDGVYGRKYIRILECVVQRAEPAHRHADETARRSFRNGAKLAIYEGDGFRYEPVFSPASEFRIDPEAALQTVFPLDPDQDTFFSGNQFLHQRQPSVDLVRAAGESVQVVHYRGLSAYLMH